VQIERDELKATKREVEGLQTLRETHIKQLTFLNQTQHDLQEQKEAIHTDCNILKNGTNVCV